MNHLKLAIVVGALLAGSACSSRRLLNVQDAADGNTTILTTFDIKNYVIFARGKYVFWECSDSGNGLTCEKRCDVRDDQGDKLKCQSFIIPSAM